MIQLVLGLAALSGVTAVLALLLEVADAYFADYGECRILINDGQKELTVQGGSKLLSTLMDQGIFIPSACGGRGSCGLCKLRVLEGGGPLLPTETPYMEAEDLQNAVRLACQVKVRNDLKLEIPPELFLIRVYRSRVVSLENLTDVIKGVELRLIDPPEISFKPGQFVQFQVPEYEGCPEPIYRAYSIASPARRADTIRLAITRAPNGLATTYIHDYLREGDEVVFNGPYGHFYLRDTDREMILVATGSGLAPILSILHQMADEGISRKATLFFGVRARKDLFYQEELRAIEQRLPTFKNVPVLSAPEPDDHWQGETGFPTDAAKSSIQDPANVEVYLCGNPLMINAAVKMFTEMGIGEDRIFYDKFG